MAMNHTTLMVLLGVLALGGCTAEQNAQREDWGNRLQRAGAYAQAPSQSMPASNNVTVCDVYRPMNCHTYTVR
jgi:hypothetical protein